MECSRWAGGIAAFCPISAEMWPGGSAKAQTSIHEGKTVDPLGLLRGIHFVSYPAKALSFTPTSSSSPTRLIHSVLLALSLFVSCPLVCSSSSSLFLRANWLCYLPAASPVSRCPGLTVSRLKHWNRPAIPARISDP